MADSGSEQAPPDRFQASPRLWLGLAIAVVALAFIFQNRDSVVINLLVFRVEAAQWVTFLTVFLVGLGTGWLLFKPRT